MDGTIRIGKKNVVIGISFLLFVLVAFGGWYAYKFRSCVGDVSYVPQREQGATTGISLGSSPYRQFLGAARDKGDYYSFRGREFKTLQDAIRACMWN